MSDHSRIRTGRFAGITGTYVDRGNTFKPLTEGTYVADNTYQARYKLAAASN
jgi:hypothetical protein